MTPRGDGYHKTLIDTARIFVAEAIGKWPTKDLNIGLEDRKSICKQALIWADIFLKEVEKYKSEI